ncbi:beta-ketoacyl synthase N-terminal-like domain-containing protein [Stigmatella sp. ncwal1]|uniref:Beta-ketoacyl synthase N-terminal-like domain-containing protein n=1 Tax=Stigmatella ashevillensis TaxID=2995309 RepID=A0ABT5D4Y9_9BACT|nr:beta-ketoacyl synthase N-terminal-like domain-containing protein [Stigmatella ashevillena]MDC0708728.1 beta-ketoacyl synthase N-terminal-like domain-containing protein [Stigmatella ashevillena]
MSLRRKTALASRFARKLQRHTTEPIAVVGMSCRFPGAPDLEAYRRLFSEAWETRREIPSERWDNNAYYSPTPGLPGAISTRHGGFIDHIDRFDAGFFRLTPREVEAMDPQHRLLLELAWEAFESASMPPRVLSGSQTGVFVGISTFDYVDLTDTHAPDGYTNTGLSHSAAVGRVSYFFDLKGPCEAIDTACSGSLVAVHNACQSLRANEVDCALAGGVNALIAPYGFMGFSQAGMMAPDGLCKTFDARADGYGRSEGCGMVVLKRLSDARRDRDIIHALITGSAVNHDGRSQGFTAPNGLAQRDVVQRAWKLGGYGPEDIDYVEAHGTGTSLGDPQELLALSGIFRGRETADKRVVVASAKTNIGHLESAAGIAGLIKLVLMVRDAEIFPHLHLQRTNPNIDLGTLPLQIPTERRPWRTRASRRVGGVSSFGFSGTNAHVLVESVSDEAEPEATEAAGAETGDGASASEGASPSETAAPPPPPPLPLRPVQIVPLSARSRTALTALAGRWSRHTREHVSDELTDLAFTAATGRHHFEHRAAVVASSRRELDAALDAARRGAEDKNLVQGGARPRVQPKLAFLFTGQGSQYPGMGRSLYAQEPVFRDALDSCALALQGLLPKPLLEVLFSPPDDPSIHQTLYSQPALFSLQFSLCKLWESWGVRPSALIGHSVGEFAAACLSGSLDLHDALRLVSSRARLMQSLPLNGSMLAVQAPSDVVRQALPSSSSHLVSIAALNGPRSTVLSGEHNALLHIASSLELSGIKSQRLSVSHAFHSPLLEPILDEFQRFAASIPSRPPRLKLISNLSGLPFSQGQAPDALYWRRHAREPVLFEQGMRSLADSGFSLFLEIGPHPTLSSLARTFLANPQGDEDERVWLSSLSHEKDDTQSILESAAALYAHGIELDWARFHERRPARKVLLPSYPFERKRHWLAPASKQQPLAPKAANGHPLLGRRLPSAMPGAQFEAILGAGSPAYLSGHRIYGLTVFPATGYVELALAAMRAVVGEHPCELENVSIERALILSDDSQRRVQVLLVPMSHESGEERFRFEIHSQPFQGDDVEGPIMPWLLHARGEARRDTATQSMPPPPHQTAESAAAMLKSEVEIAPKDFYKVLTERGMGYTGAFRPLTSIRRGSHGSGMAFAHAALPAEEHSHPVQPNARHVVHPALLDGCLQAIGAALTTKFAAGNAINMAYLPVAIGRVRLRRPPGNEVSSHVEVQFDKGLEYSATLSVFSADGSPALEIEGLRMQGVERSRLREATSERQQGADILHKLGEASLTERWGLMVSFLANQVADIMGIESNEIEGGLMYFELGMNSLGSVELQYRIQKNLRCELPKNLIVDYESTESLATRLLTQVFGQDSFQRVQP